MVGPVGSKNGEVAPRTPSQHVEPLVEPAPTSSVEKDPAALDLPCFQAQHTAKVVNSEGELLPKYAKRSLPALNDEERRVFRDKFFAPLSVKDNEGNDHILLVLGVCLLKSLDELPDPYVVESFNLIGGHLLYSLLYEFPDYAQRLFADLPVEAQEALFRALREHTPTKPKDMDIRIKVANKDGKEVLSRDELKKIRNHFLKPVGNFSNVAFQKLTTLYTDKKKFQIIFFEGTDIELSICVDDGRDHLFYRDGFYQPMEDLLRGEGVSCEPLSYYTDAPRQGLFDMIHKIVRADNWQDIDYQGFYRLTSLLTQGYSCADKELTGGLAVIALADAALKTQVNEIRRCLANHHGSDPQEHFAYLFNFTHHGNLDDEAAAALWFEIYGEGPYGKDSWMEDIIRGVIAKTLPFSALVKVLGGVFVLGPQTGGPVVPGTREFDADLYFAKLGGAILQLKRPPGFQAPKQGEELDLFRRVANWSAGFSCPDTPSNTKRQALSNLLEYLAEHPELIDLGGAVAAAILFEERGKGTENSEKISKELVRLAGKVSALKLAQVLMELGSRRGIIRTNSSECQQGWLYTLRREWDNGFDEVAHYKRCCELIRRTWIQAATREKNYFAKLLKEKASDDFLPQWLSVVSLSATVRGELLYDAIERQLGCNKSCEAQRLLSFLQPEDLPLDQEFALLSTMVSDSHTLRRILELAVKHQKALPSSVVNALIANIGGDPDLKPLVEKALPFIQEYALFFDLLVAAQKSMISFTWSPKMEVAWVASLEAALHAAVPPLQRVQEMLRLPAKYRGSQAHTETCWATLGMKWIDVEQVENVHECVKNTGGLDLLMAAAQFFIEEGRGEFALEALEKVYLVAPAELERVVPLYFAALELLPELTLRATYLKQSRIVLASPSSAKEVVKACVLAMFTPASPKNHPTKACELLKQFSDLYAEGEGPLWLSFLEKLRDQRPKEVWPYLKKIDSYLMSDKNVRARAWLLALEAILKKDRKNILKFIFAENSALPRLDEATAKDLDVAIAAHLDSRSPQQRLSALMKLSDNCRLGTQGKLLLIKEGLRSTDLDAQNVALSLLVLAIDIGHPPLSQDERFERLKDLIALKYPPVELILKLDRTLNEADQDKIDWMPLLRYCALNPKKIELSLKNMCWLSGVVTLALHSRRFSKIQDGASLLSGLMAILEEYCNEHSLDPGFNDVIIGIGNIYRSSHLAKDFPQHFNSPFFWDFLSGYLEKVVATINTLEAVQVIELTVVALSCFSTLSPARKKLITSILNFIIAFKVEGETIKARLTKCTFQLLVGGSGGSGPELATTAFSFLAKVVAKPPPFDVGLMDAARITIEAVLIPYFCGKAHAIAQQIEGLHENVLELNVDEAYTKHWRTLGYRQLYRTLFGTCLQSSDPVKLLKAFCGTLCIPLELLGDTEAIRAYVASLPPQERELRRSVRIDAYVAVSEKFLPNNPLKIIDQHDVGQKIRFFLSFFTSYLREGWFVEEPFAVLQMTEELLTYVSNFCLSGDPYYGESRDICLEMLRFTRMISETFSSDQLAHNAEYIGRLKGEAQRIAKVWQAQW